MAHDPVTTLEELDALDRAEMLAGYFETERGDPEPGSNHSRSYHHGWRTRMMDLHEIEIPIEHRRLTHLLVTRDQGWCRFWKSGQPCRWCGI